MRTKDRVLALSAALVPALVLASLPFVTAAWSQSPPAAPAPAAPAAPPPGCNGPEYRQFDFWVGEWEVLDPTGKRVGDSSIRLILGGCVVLENWKGGGGVEGTSFNIYDRTDRQWHQSWVDGSGSRLELAGGLRGPSMVLSGVSAAPKGGGKVTERITWTPLEGGKVRQLWEQSSDGGVTWTAAFDGTYVKRAANPSR